MKKLLIISIITTLMVLSGCKSEVTEVNTTTPVEPSTTNTPPEQTPATTTTPTQSTTRTDYDVYLVALNDDGKSGIKVGCGDSLVPVKTGFLFSSDANQLITTSLEHLFAIRTQNYERYSQPNLYNALYNSDLKIDSVKMEDSKTTVNLSGKYTLGGVCDNPRFENQITQTIKQFTGSSALTVFINEKEIHSLMSGK